MSDVATTEETPNVTEQTPNVEAVSDVREGVKDLFLNAAKAAFQDPGVVHTLRDLYGAQAQATNQPNETNEQIVERLGGILEGRMAQAAHQASERAIASAQFRPADPAAIKRITTWPPEEALLRRPKEELTEEQSEVCRFYDDIYLCQRLMQAAKTGKNGVPTPHGQNALGLMERRLDQVNAPEHLRTLVTGTSTGASEWVPTLLSPDYYSLIDDQLVLAPIFPRFTMAGKNVTIPTAAGRGDVYIRTEGTAVTIDASIVSGSQPFVAVALSSRQRISEELDADSLLSSMDIVKVRLSEGLAEAIDKAVDNGDTASPHHDSDITSAADPRKAWIGIREKALTNTGANVDLGTFNLDNLVSIPSKMGRYAEPQNLVWIVPPLVFWGKLPALKDASNNAVFLPGTFGNQESPVVKGFSGVRLMGAPIYNSSLLRTDLDATGVYSSSGTKTCLYAVNGKAWLLGVRREVDIIVGYDEENGYYKIVANWRGDFHHMDSTNLTTAMGYDIS